MKKVLFIIETKHYSTELLARCLEKYTEATCFTFFSKEEMMMYLDLKPTHIICDGEEFDLSKEEIDQIRTKMNALPKVYSISNEEIHLTALKSNGLKLIKKLQYRNLFSSLTSLVNNVQKERRASMMMMY